MMTLIEGALLSVLVVLIFLRDWRATVITALALPLSIIPTFFALDALGFSLNLVSLLAMTLATGMLVDDAIVEIENIVRHMHMGKTAWRASLEAADEIGLAVIAITLTIIAVFAPVSFMGGIAGQYFKQFGLTVAVAVIFSLLVARLITPLLAAYFMRAHPLKEQREGLIMRSYTRLVAWSVRHRFLTILRACSSSSARSRRRSCCRRASCPRRTSRVSSWRWNCRRARAPRTRCARSTTSARGCASDPKSRACSSTAEGRPWRGGSAQGEDRHQPRTQEPARTHAAEVRNEIGRIVADVPDIRTWFLNENGQRELTLVVPGADTARSSASPPSSRAR